MELELAYPKSSIWKYREFTLLLSACLLLSIGNKVYELLLPLIMYDISGGSSIVMTSMRTAELLPNLFFGILVGVIVDRVDKKKWAIWMILLQTMILVGIYVMFGMNVYQPIVFYVFGFMLMTLNYGFFNTQVSLMKLSVPSSMLTSANAKFSFVETFVSIMGPVFLGLVLLVATKTQGLIVTIVLYGAAYVLMMNLSIPVQEEIGKKQSFWIDLKEGWGAFKENQPLKLMTMYIILLNCSMTVVSTSVLIFGTADLQLSNASLSTILSVQGVGGLIASLCINRLRQKYKLGVMFGVAILGNGLSYFGLYVTDSWFLLGLSLLINGFATTVYIICAYTFRHEQTPAHLMGRIGGITGTLFRTGMPIAMLFSGWMINWWGTSSVFVCAAISNLVVFAFYKKSLLWKLQ